MFNRKWSMASFPPQPAQQIEVMKPGAQAGFAVAGLTHTEGKGNFSHRIDAAADQNLQQKFEAAPLQLDPLHAAPAYEKEPGERIFDANRRPLYRLSQQDAQLRDQAAKRVPAAHAARRGIAAGNCDIGACLNSLP